MRARRSRRGPQQHPDPVTELRLRNVAAIDACLSDSDLAYLNLSDVR